MLCCSTRSCAVRLSLILVGFFAIPGWMEPPSFMPRHGFLTREPDDGVFHCFAFHNNGTHCTTLTQDWCDSFLTNQGCGMIARHLDLGLMCHGPQLWPCVHVSHMISLCQESCDAHILPHGIFPSRWYCMRGTDMESGGQGLSFEPSSSPGSLHSGLYLPPEDLTPSVQYDQLVSCGSSPEPPFPNHPLKMGYQRDLTMRFQGWCYMSTLHPFSPTIVPFGSCFAQTAGKKAAISERCYHACFVVLCIFGMAVWLGTRFRWPKGTADMQFSWKKVDQCPRGTNEEVPQVSAGYLPVHHGAPSPYSSPYSSHSTTPAVTPTLPESDLDYCPHPMTPALFPYNYVLFPYNHVYLYLIGWALPRRTR